MTQTTYAEFIQDILDTRGRFGIPTIDENGRRIYKERHHILPKSLGGTNNRNNLIDLFAREHFIAHMLLAKENPTNSSLIYAWWNMCQIKGRNYQDRYVPTAEEYEESRIAVSLILSESRMGNKNPMYGKSVTLSDEQRIQTAERNRKRIWTKESREKARQSKLGRKLTDECKSKIGQANKGKGRPGEQVLCIELNKTFKSIMDAERETGIANTNIGLVCRNQRKTAGGYHWQYV